MRKVARRRVESKKYACSSCGYITGSPVEKCPVCGGEVFTDIWAGRFIVIDPKASRLWKLFKEIRGIERDHEAIFAIEIE